MAALGPSVPDRMHPPVSEDEAPAGGTKHVPPGRPSPTCISVLWSFLVSPSHMDLWIETWQELAKLADMSPGCHHFRLAQDRNDGMYFAIYSEWDDVTSYHSFEQEARVRSAEQDLAAMGFLEEARVLEVVPVESTAMQAPGYRAMTRRSVTS